MMDPELVKADIKFHDFLTEWIKKQNCRFVMESFLGREPKEFIDGMAVDDVSGYLIPLDLEEEPEDYGKYYGWIEWSMEDGKLVLTWNKETMTDWSY